MEELKVGHKNQLRKMQTQITDAKYEYADELRAQREQRKMDKVGFVVDNRA